MKFVRSAVGPALLVTLMLSPVFAGRAETPSAPDPAERRYLVKFRDFSRGASDVAQAGGRVAAELAPQRVMAAWLPAVAVRGLEKNPNIEYVEPDQRRYPQLQTKPYGVAMVQADNAVFAGSGASVGSTVCIIDSGYSLAHEDLQDVNVTGTNDPGTGNWFEDTCGHGSHVAGTIAALNNSTGVVGVNGNGLIRLHIEKVFNGSTCGWAYSSDLIGALNRCRNAVAGTGQNLVVSMSLGGGSPSGTEDAAFQAAYDAGVLSVAAAGNGGNTSTLYPAGYDSVVSVAAVDRSGVVAGFSQQNDDVELAAPGVGVVSTTPFRRSTLGTANNRWFGQDITGSARVDVEGTLVDGGLCDSAGAWTGSLVLCLRGGNTFAEKVVNVETGGGVGVAVYNNVVGGFAGTLNTTSALPAISLSQADGQAALLEVGTPALIANSVGTGSGYESYDGTSMATPHVSGVAALLWSMYPAKTNADIRKAMQVTAQDMGAVGRDNIYGFGLVQAKGAYDYLALESPKIDAFTLSKSTTAGCLSTTGTVTLASPAPAGGGVVFLSDSLDSATPPATVTIAAGTVSGSFVIKTVPVAALETGTVSATYLGTTLTRNLSVRPMGVLSVSMSPTSVVGGKPSTGTVKLECKAGPGAVTVGLGSSNPSLAVPATPSVSVPFGVNSATFTVNTNPVLAKTTTSIAASANGINKSKTLTLTPAAVASPTTVRFGTVTAGTTSAPINVTLTNKGVQPFTISGITLVGTNAARFAQTNACPASLAPGASCVIAVTFSPVTAPLGVSAKLNIATSATSTPISVALSGSGV